MQYSHELISERDVPRTRRTILQHLVETYASEANKLCAVWSELRDDQLEFRLHPRSSSIRQIMVHQILSERRFFAEFIGLTEPPVESLLPPGDSPPVRAHLERVIALRRARLTPLADTDEPFWLAEVPFFDVRRQRIWVFWRRVVHTAHHRAETASGCSMCACPPPMARPRMSPGPVPIPRSLWTRRAGPGHNAVCGSIAYRFGGTTCRLISKRAPSSL
jgi:DinB family protein